MELCQKVSGTESIVLNIRDSHMFKKIQKLIKTPNIYFYDMFAKRLNKPVYAKTVASKAQSNKLAASKKVENLQHTDLEMIIRQVQGNISLNTKILSKLTRGTLYNNNKEINDSPWDLLSEKSVGTIRYGKHLRSYQIFFPKLRFVNTTSEENLKDSFSRTDFHIIHGQNIHSLNAFDIAEGINSNIPTCYGEDGFLHSIGRSVDFSLESRYRTGCSLTLDFHSAHFDCNHVSWLEKLLNSSYTFTEEEIVRARNCIKFILDNYISKYNNQPIYTPKYCKTDRKKVLVIDQAVNDFSIQLGGCTEQTFNQMLHDAIKENPDADILVKVHPDMIQNPNRGGAGTKKFGHFTGINLAELSDNIILIADYLNPLALLKAVDKVYVATSQMGFEALLCGKEVYIYGCPFYAGWGVGVCRGDQSILSRRNKSRSIYEIFSAAYIKYTRYINPDLGRRCEIEECLTFLKSARDKYFIENTIEHELIEIENISSERKEKIANVAFCFDANYCKQAMVAILSLLDSNLDDELTYAIFCVIESDVTSELQKQICDLVNGNRSLHSIKFIENKNNRDLYETRGISKAAYTRLRLHELLPEVNKIIYSDIDVIFNGSMRELWETELGDYLLGACIDPLMNQKQRWQARCVKYYYWKKLLFNAQDNYFSSGLLLMNLQKMREEDYSKTMSLYEGEKFEYQDMDIINITINNRIKHVSNKYCVLTGLIMNGYVNIQKLDIIPTKYLDDIKNDPKIFHFAGKKPWDDKNVPRGEIWWSFVEGYPSLYKYFQHRILTNLNI